MFGYPTKQFYFFFCNQLGVFLFFFNEFSPFHDTGKPDYNLRICLIDVCKAEKGSKYQCFQLKIAGGKKEVHL